MISDLQNASCFSKSVNWKLSFFFGFRFAHCVSVLAELVGTGCVDDRLVCCA